MPKSIQLRIRFYRNSCLKRPMYRCYSILLYIHTHNILNLAYFSFFYFFSFSSSSYWAPCMLCILSVPTTKHAEKVEEEKKKDQNYAYNSDCKWNRNRLNCAPNVYEMLYICECMQILFKYTKKREIWQ